jgi:hypothetical protein
VRISNLNDSLEVTADGVRAIRVAERAGADHLGARYRSISVERARSAEATLYRRRSRHAP